MLMTQSAQFRVVDIGRLALCLCCLAWGCQSGHSNDVESVYSERCSGCHGVNGDGRGESAKHLPDKPTNFTDPHWRRSVSSEYVKTVITEGGTAVGISPLMPSNTDLKEREKLVSELVNFVLTRGK